MASQCFSCKQEFVWGNERGDRLDPESQEPHECSPQEFGENSGSLSLLGQGEITSESSWIALRDWGKENRFDNYSVDFCLGIWEYIRKKRSLTERQINFARRIWNEAIAKGFEPLIEKPVNSGGQIESIEIPDIPCLDHELVNDLLPGQRVRSRCTRCGYSVIVRT